MEVMLTGQKDDSIAKITMWSEQKQLKKSKITNKIYEVPCGWRKSCY